MMIMNEREFHRMVEEAVDRERREYEFRSYVDSTFSEFNKRLEALAAEVARLKQLIDGKEDKKRPQTLRMGTSPIREVERQQQSEEHRTGGHRDGPPVCAMMNRARRDDP